VGRYLTFVSPQSRRRAEVRRPTSTDARLISALGTVHEAQETYACQLVDHYSATLVRLAWVISGDCTIASSAVVKVIVAAALDHARLEPSRAMLFDLSRQTMWASLAAADDTWSPASWEEVAGADARDVLRSIDPRDRALVALTLFGDHTYREAATVLGLAPDVAADLLRDTLVAIGQARSA